MYWIQAYQKAVSSVEFEVTGGGSTAGIEALHQGKADIAMCTRAMKEQEKNSLSSMVLVAWRHFKSLPAIILWTIIMRGIHIDPSDTNTGCPYR
jgi:hypothetical protein